MDSISEKTPLEKAMSGDKYCVDCRFCVKSSLGEDYYKCVRPPGTTSTITGVEKYPSNKFCSIERSGDYTFSSYCGLKGKFFEAKRTKPKKWYQFWRSE